MVITEEVDIKPVILETPSPPSNPENGNVENGEEEEDRYICNLSMKTYHNPFVWQE